MGQITVMTGPERRWRDEERFQIQAETLARAHVSRTSPGGGTYRPA